MMMHHFAPTDIFLWKCKCFAQNFRITSSEVILKAMEDVFRAIDAHN